jgi:hypothetical protein
MLPLTFRQAQCDFARCQSELVEDCALAITFFKQFLYTEKLFIFLF